MQQHQGLTHREATRVREASRPRHPRVHCMPRRWRCIHAPPSLRTRTSSDSTVREVTPLSSLHHGTGEIPPGTPRLASLHPDRENDGTSKKAAGM